MKNELPHDKTNKMTVCQAKTQISLGIRQVWSESLLCAQWLAKDLSFLHADSELWSDCADAQADLSLRWAHMPFCWFCLEAAQITKHNSKQNLHKKRCTMVDDGMIDKMKTLYPTKIPHTLYEGGASIMKPEDYWSCIAHLGAEDFSKSAVIEEKKFKNIESDWIGPRSINELDLWYS